jgi:hypothetical protein
MSMLVIVALFGALGGLLHATNSLVAFVGNRTFVSSWAFFYMARPFVGAVMALLVFLVFKGHLSNEIVKMSEIFSIAAVAGLVGMFSDRTAEKLKEVFDVVLGPKADQRANKLQGGQPTKPTIAGVTPERLTVGAAPPVMLVVKGTGFDAKTKGQVNGKERPTTFQNESQLTIELDAADVAAAGTIVVTVANPKGETSAAFAVSVL